MIHVRWLRLLLAALIAVVLPTAIGFFLDLTLADDFVASVLGMASAVIISWNAVYGTRHWWIALDVKPAKPETTPTAIPETPPEIPPADPMVLCPECQLLGYHTLDEVPAVTNPIRTYTQPDGEVIEVNVWAGGIPGHYRRQCIFCDHVWAVPLDT